MKPIKGCKQDEVWRHWNKVEKVPENAFEWRSDIRNPVPSNVKWFLVEIEEKDIPRIYIISSDDWKTVAPSFRLLEAVDSLDKDIKDEKIGNIKDKRTIYQKNIEGLDRRLILVSPTVEGSFTIIEGNKRAVALQSIKKLVGTQVYLGISGKIKDYWWARCSK